MLIKLGKASLGTRTDDIPPTPLPPGVGGNLAAAAADSPPGGAAERTTPQTGGGGGIGAEIDAGAGGGPTSSYRVVSTGAMSPTAVSRGCQIANKGALQLAGIGLQLVKWAIKRVLTPMVHTS